MTCIPPGLFHESVSSHKRELIILGILQMTVKVSNLCADDIIEQILRQYGGIRIGHFAVERKSTPNDRTELADQGFVLDNNFLESLSNYLERSNTAHHTEWCV
jgi:hypothetical protein